ncbi:MAG: hypothetical protein ACRENE_09350, partial [Polyangiaceae bacterium]
MARTDFGQRVPAYLLAVSSALVVAVGCTAQTTTPGELIVVIDADVALPKDIDSFRLEVLHGAGGPLLYGQDFEVPSQTHLPATLAVEAGPGDNHVDVRVIGSKGSTAKVLREAVTTVPVARQATLRMPLQWLCYGQVTTQDTTIESTCPSGQTCAEGTCTSDVVDSATLPSYAPAQVFGGGAGPGSGGTCFDAVGCFAQGYVPVVDT